MFILQTIVLILSRSWPSLDLGPCPLSGAPLHLSLHFALILGRDDCHLQAVFPKSWSLTSHSLQLKLAALFWSLSHSASVCVMIGSLHVHPPAPIIHSFGASGVSLLTCLCIPSSVPVLCMSQDTERPKLFRGDVPKRKEKSGVTWLLRARCSSFVGTRHLYVCAYSSQTTLRVTYSIPHFVVKSS